MAVTPLPNVVYHKANLWTMTDIVIYDGSGNDITSTLPNFPGRTVMMEVTGLELTAEITSVVESGTEQPVQVVRQGKKPSAITIRRGLATDQATGAFQSGFADWMQRGYSVSFILNHFAEDTLTSNKVLKYDIRKAVASRYKAPDLNVASTDYAIEEIEILPASLDFVSGP